MATSTATDYPFIRLWEAHMGGGQYYLDLQLALARANNVPQDVIYNRKSGKDYLWTRLNNISNPAALISMLRIQQKAIETNS